MSNAIIGALRVHLGIDTAAFHDGLESATKTLGRVGNDMRRVGRQLSLYVTAPIAGFGALTIKTAGDFESSMNKVAAVSGAVGDQFDALREQAKELGRTTQFSASEAADAMSFLAMAGFDANKILASMPATLDLAAAAAIPLEQAADIVSNIITGYGKDVEDLGSVTDALVETFTNTNTNLVQLGEAMKYAAPLASAAGIDFNEAAAAIGLMGNAGIQGSMAGTSLRTAIVRMLNPTRAARDILSEMGESVSDLELEELEQELDALTEGMNNFGISFTNAEGKLKPLAQILEELAPHAEQVGDNMTLFGVRAGPAMQALLSQGSDALRDLTEQLDNSGGRAKEVADVQMAGFNGAMRELVSAFEGLQIAIADSGLLEFVTEMTRALSGLVRSLSDVNPRFVRAGVVVAALAAAVGPLLISLGVMAIAIAAIGAPLALIIAGIAAATAAIVVFWPEIQALRERMTAWRIEMQENVVGALSAFERATQSASDAVIAFGRDAIEWIMGKFEELLEFFHGLPDQMRQIGIDIIEGLRQGLAEGWEMIKAEVSEIAAGVSGRFRDLFGIRSPSSVFREIGENIMRGLGQGIETEAEHVKRGIGLFADDLKRAFDGILRGTMNFRDAMSGILSGVGGKLIDRGFGSVFSRTIPGFANGTRFAPGGWAMVGERGPELVNLPRGAQVVPNHKLGGMTINLSVPINAPGADAQQLARVQAEVHGLRDALPELVHRAIADPRLR